MNDIPKCSGGEPVEDRACDSEVENMSAKEVCEAVQKKKRNIWDAIVEGNPLNVLIKAFSSDAQVSDNIQNDLDININTTTIINQMASCDNVISQIQTNVLRGPSPECVTAWVQAGATLKEIKEASTVQNISQKNVADAKLDCQTNQIIEALSKMDATIDNLAMQEALAEAKGLLSDADVNQNVCNNVNVNMSACKYISQNQCCSQVIQQQQKNLIDKQCSLGKWTNITQKNDAKALAMCRMNANSSISDTLAGDIINKTNQSGKGKATGFTTSFMAMIIIIIVLVIAIPLVLKLILRKKMMDKKGSLTLSTSPTPPTSSTQSTPSTPSGGAESRIKESPMIYYTFVIISGLLLSAGVVCIILFFTTKKKQVVVIDKPFIRCTNTLAKDKSQRITFKQIKEKAQADSDIIGFDFFPDDIHSNPAKLNETQLGLGILLSYIEKDDVCKSSLDISKERSISIIKKQTNYLFIIFGILLILAGILIYFI